MIKNLAITPPVIGRISIGRVVEKSGKRLPEKDDQFTITTQIQSKDGWLLHPLNDELRKDTPNSKLRAIPVRMLFDDPDLNLRAEYTLFDRKTGRPLCVGDGETCRRQTEEGIQNLPCPSPDKCPLAQGGACKPYGRLSARIGDDEDVGVFVFRTTGYNSIRTLTARLRYYHALSGGTLATLPLALKLRGKSTTQSHRTPIYYVDLAVRDDATLEASIAEAKALAQARSERGIDQQALDDVARSAFECMEFELLEDEGLQVVEEFVSEPDSEQESPPNDNAPTVSKLGQKLAQQQAAGC